jgi:predicted dehydrogenase
MMTEQAAGVALIGCGTISPYLLKGLAGAKGDLRVACDQDLQRARQAGEAFGAEACTDLEDVLAREDVAGVVVALPTFLHAGTVSRCLEAGKHVFCEKPLGLDPAESLDLTRNARAAGRVLQVGYMKRFHPAFGRLKGLLGELGGCYYAEVRLTVGGRGPASEPPTGELSWHNRPEQAGGGFLVHSGSHLLDLIHYTFGPVRRATGRCERDAARNESFGSYLLETDSGVNVHLLLARAALPAVSARGTKWDEQVLATGAAGRFHAAGFDWTGDTPGALTIERCGREVEHSDGVDAAEQWTGQMRAFLDACGDGRDRAATGEEGYRVDVVLDALKNLEGPMRSVEIEYAV